MDWLDLLAVQGPLKSLLQNHSSKASIHWLSAFFIVHQSTLGKVILRIYDVWYKMHLYRIFIHYFGLLWRRQWQPTLVLLPGKSNGWRSQVGCSLWGRWVRHDWATSFPFHFPALEKEMATPSSVLAWRIPGVAEPGGLQLWGRTVSDTTEATLQQPQQHRLLQWLSSKSPPANAEVAGSIPGWGRSPGEGNGNPLQYSCLGNPMDTGAWWAMVYRVVESDMT